MSRKRSTRSARRGAATPFLALALLFVLAAGCLPVVVRPAGRPLAVTSVTVLADLARQVAGDRVEVRSLVPPGADVHTWQPTPRDAEQVQAARIVFLNGLGLEGASEDLFRANARGPIVVLSEGLEVIREADEPGGNPHLWLDPRNAQRYVERIRDGFAQVDPSGRAEYEANAERYLAELRALDAEVEQTLAVIPPERRKLVTFHDAFPYLARRYNLELVGVVLRSPGREPSAQEVAELVARIRAENVPAVYAEPQFSARILELAARDAGVEVLPLYSDTLDERVPGYVELLRFDAGQLVQGLGGGQGMGIRGWALGMRSVVWTHRYEHESVPDRKLWPLPKGEGRSEGR